MHPLTDTFSIHLSALFSPSEVANSLLLSFGVLAVVLAVLTRGRLGYREEDPNRLQHQRKG